MAAKRIPLKERQEVEIRGTRWGLVITLDATVPADRLAGALRDKLTAARGFFNGATCDLLWQPAGAAASLDTAALAAVLAEHGLRLRREVGALPEAGASTGGQQALARPSTASAPEPALRTATRRRGPEVLTLPAGEALLYPGILRGGQSLRHPGSVVIVGHVNPGALVEAGGHVLVLGRLAGTVRAGWPDNRRAVIVTWHLAGRQLAVAGHHLAEEAEPPCGPCLVRLYRGKLRLERWEGS